MKQQILRILKVIGFLCVIILCLGLVYLVYTTYFKEHKKAYFDGITAITMKDDIYVSVGSINDNDYQYDKAKITRYNKKKEKIWEKIFNKGYNSVFFDVLLDGEDTVVVGSYEASQKEKEDKIRTALLIKYDKDGEIIFEKEFQELGNSKFISVTIVEDGYLVVGQSIYEEETVGNSTQGGAILAKYSKDGKPIWQKNYGSNKVGCFQDLLVLGDYIYVVGKESEEVGVLAKYTMAGEEVRTVTYSTTDSVGFTSIASLDDKLFVTAAKRQGEAQYDALLVEYDLDLDYMNEVTYHSGDKARFSKVIIDDNQDLVVIGQEAKKKKNHYSYNAIIGKYRSNLEKADVFLYGNEEDDYFTDIIMDGKAYLITGYSYYKKDGYLSKLLTYSDALKPLEVK